VLAVLTAKDVAEAGYKSIPTNLGVRTGSASRSKTAAPVLAQGKVRHVGECVAASSPSRRSSRRTRPN